jgi:hypothetical protein
MAKNCSILSQKVPKFELYKHNDELFNIYYGIFLWTLNFYRVWPIMQIRKKGGWNLKNLLLCNGGHLGYRTTLTDTILKGDHLRIISAKFGWDWLSSFRGEDIFFNPFKIVSISTVLYPRWPPLLKIEISSKGQSCSILSQKVSKCNCINIMMSFLTYITGIFMNFEILPILTDYAN